MGVLCKKCTGYCAEPWQEKIYESTNIGNIFLDKGNVDAIAEEKLVLIAHSEKFFGKPVAGLAIDNLWS